MFFQDMFPMRRLTTAVFLQETVRHTLLLQNPELDLSIEDILQ